MLNTNFLKKSHLSLLSVCIFAYVLRDPASEI